MCDFIHSNPLSPLVSFLICKKSLGHISKPTWSAWEGARDCAHAPANDLRLTNCVKLCDTWNICECCLPWKATPLPTRSDCVCQKKKSLWQIGLVARLWLDAHLLKHPHVESLSSSCSDPTQRPLVACRPIDVGGIIFSIQFWMSFKSVFTLEKSTWNLGERRAYLAHDSIKCIKFFGHIHVDMFLWLRKCWPPLRLFSHSTDKLNVVFSFEERIFPPKKVSSNVHRGELWPDELRFSLRSTFCISFRSNCRRPVVYLTFFTCEGVEYRVSSRQTRWSVEDESMIFVTELWLSQLKEMRQKLYLLTSNGWLSCRQRQK